MLRKSPNTMQTAEIVDQLTEEEFYLFPNLDILPPSMITIKLPSEYYYSNEEDTLN